MVRKIVRNLFHRMRLVQNRNNLLRVESSNMSRLSLERLTDEESKAVACRWKGISELNISDKYYRMFKSLEHFDADFVSDDLFMPFILRRLNEKSAAEAFVHKGLYDILFRDLMARPKTIVNNINGTYYDSEVNPISFKEALAKLDDEKSFVIKPTLGSCMGHGVIKVESSKYNNESLLNQYANNFIVQRVVTQSSFTAQFNPPSLNTFRISTLNINGKVSVCSILFKCGQTNAIVDNGGAGGLMVGVDEKGRFRNYGYNNHYEKFYKTKDGVEFSGKIVGSMDKVLEQVCRLHQQCLPSMGFAGWDIALGEFEEPIMIEVNLVWPGIQFEQLGVGKPIFGDRTDEVIDYVKKMAYSNRL